MAKGPEIPQTDSAEIEILIERLKQNKLEQRDVELIERLLRTVMALVNLLQRKNMSIKRLRDLIFGRRTEKRCLFGELVRRRDFDGLAANLLFSAAVLCVK